MKISLFQGAKDPYPSLHDLTWESFVQALGPHQYHPGPKDSLPAFSPAEFTGRRQQRNVIQVHFGVLDLDRVSAQEVQDLVQALTSSGQAALLYTTWSHTTKPWSLRLCVPFTRPVLAQEWRMFWALLAGRWPCPPDSQCKDSSRFFFGPFVPMTDRLSDHSYVVLPGEPLDVDALLSSPVLPPAPTQARKITRSQLQGLSRTWLRARDPNRAHLGQALQALVRGEAYAQEGERDTLTFQLCSDLAQLWPDAEPQTLAQHFAQSLQLMGAPTLEETQAKIERAQERIREEAHADAQGQLLAQRALLRAAWSVTSTPHRETPYTSTERPPTDRAWILQQDRHFWIWVGGRYIPIVDREDSGRDLLAPASSHGVEIHRATPQGLVPKTLSQLVSDYGDRIQRVIYDLTLDVPSWDPGPAKTLRLAPCPRRALTPAYDSEVANWLSLLCGPDLPAVETWLAHVMDLHRTAAALLFTGPPATGKSLFGAAVARLWQSDKPTALHQVLGAWSDQIVECPLILGDEDIPRDMRGYAKMADLRSLIADHARPYTKKYAHDNTILGCVRVVLTANRETILDTAQDLTEHDIDAISDRFYHVRIPDDSAAQYLRTVDAASIVTQNRLARHALWLREHRPGVPQGRFLIGQPDQRLARSLTVRSGTRSAICAWALAYLRDPRRVDARRDYLIRVKDGQLWVTAYGLQECWDLHAKMPAPTIAEIGRALTALAQARRCWRRPRGLSQQNYRALNTDLLILWAEEHDVWTGPEIRQALSRDTPTEEEKKILS